jgi:hypothetical protein
MINSATILSKQKSIACIQLLSTCCNCAISLGFHSSCLILFVGWLYSNIFIHSYNICGKSQKKTSCNSLNMYLSKYLCSVNFEVLLSFCENSSSFVFNHIYIYAFIGFHGLNITFYICILSTTRRHSFDAYSKNLTYSIPFSSRQPTKEAFVGFSLLFYWS